MLCVTSHHDKRVILNKNLSLCNRIKGLEKSAAADLLHWIEYCKGNKRIFKHFITEICLLPFLFLSLNPPPPNLPSFSGGCFCLLVIRDMWSLTGYCLNIVYPARRISLLFWFFSQDQRGLCSSSNHSLTQFCKVRKASYYRYSLNFVILFFCIGYNK